MYEEKNPEMLQRHEVLLFVPEQVVVVSFCFDSMISNQGETRWMVLRFIALDHGSLQISDPNSLSQSTSTLSAILHAFSGVIGQF